MDREAHILTYLEFLLNAKNAEFAEERLKSEISSARNTNQPFGLFYAKQSQFL